MTVEFGFVFGEHLKGAGDVDFAVDVSAFDLGLGRRAVVDDLETAEHQHRGVIEDHGFVQDPRARRRALSGEGHRTGARIELRIDATQQLWPADSRHFWKRNDNAGNETDSHLGEWKFRGYNIY